MGGQRRAVLRRLPALPASLLARVRLVFLAFAVVFALLMVSLASADSAHVLVVLVMPALLGLPALWCWGYRLGGFPLPVAVAELALVLCVHAGDGSSGYGATALLLGLIHRSLYGRTSTVVTTAAAWGACGVVGALLQPVLGLPSPADQPPLVVTASLTAVLLVLLALPFRALASVLDRHEQAVARERVLLHGAADLATAPTREEVLRLGARAARDLLRTAPQLAARAHELTVGLTGAGPGDHADLPAPLSDDPAQRRVAVIGLGDPRERERLVRLGHPGAADASVLVHVPLVRGFDVVGTLTVAGPLAPPADLLESLTALAALVVLGLDRAEFAEQLRRQAFTDPLTGLANRALLFDRLERALAEVHPGRSVGVLLLDLDGFKAVNDTLGHAAGDQLLTAVAGRLRGCVRTPPDRDPADPLAGDASVEGAPSEGAGGRYGDLVARLGGDEFAVLVTPAHPEVLAAIADRMLEAVTAPTRLTLGRHGAVEMVSVGVSIGTAYATRDEGSAELLQHADAAMYLAKASGKRRAVAHPVPVGDRVA